MRWTIRLLSLFKFDWLWYLIKFIFYHPFQEKIQMQYVEKQAEMDWQSTKVNTNFSNDANLYI